MGDLRQGIVSIINSWDPIGLMTHAPDDEYNPEVDEILGLVVTAQDDDSLAQGIFQVFVRQFGDDTFHGSMEDCVRVARDIRRLMSAGDS